MTTSTPESKVREGAADFAADFGRLAAGMLENTRAMPIHPLMAHPAAAFAAATAIGFGLSTQMAGAFFGALQGALETANMAAAALDETPPEEETPELDIHPDNIRQPVEKAKPVRRAAKPKLTVVSTKPPAEKSTKPAAAAKARPAARSRKADDLKLIAGIGPKLEQVLNGKGIRTFADIAAWSDQDVARLDAELGVDGRILRDDWVGQAKVLAMRGRRKK
ncbi:NADH-quinone oxidoreductase subunit E [Rhizobium sp. BK650]|uniref:5' DNA nuclease n=1 Tax=Rhizobium sp. BK650 TaxID=2586990 RepID=UPI001610ED05|nr:5' DNA nuclease [Rhizobium sp. BK650]MBB3657563.1 NADH-quinone oxidoreductase subunit E [Rhizobium sp. BK650]